MNLILSACSIRSRFLYSVYLFCLGFPESRRQTACFAFLIRLRELGCLCYRPLAEYITEEMGLGQDGGAG